MKKYFVLGGMMIAVLVLSNCNPAKKSTSTTTTTDTTPKLTYESHLSSVIMSNCSPCHIPAKGGNKKAYDNYANVKTDIDEMIRRMELPPTEKGFMPFRKAKLPDSTIAVFKQWRTDGVL